MTDLIKNKQIKLTEDSELVIQGRFGYDTKIKNIYVVNNLSISSKISILVYSQKTQDKIYYIKSIPIPALKRFEIPLDNLSIVLNNSDYLIVEADETIVDIDVFCNYIETEKYFDSLIVEIQNQKGQLIKDISFKEEKVASDYNKKKITFESHPDYTDIEEIVYITERNKFIVYKPLKNKVFIKKNCSFIEFQDRFEIDMFNSKKESPEKDVIIGILQVTTESEEVKWRIKQKDEINYSDWYNSQDSIQLLPDEYIINFTSSYNNYSLKIYDDNVIQLYFPFNNNSDKGRLLVQKPVTMPKNSAEGIRFRLIDESNNKTDWYKYNTTYEFPFGDYKIEFAELDNFYSAFIADVSILKDQLTIFELDNSLLFSNQTTFLINETPPTIIVEALEKARLSVVFSPEKVLSESPKWRVEYFTNIFSNWYNNAEEIKLDSGLYKINFQDVDTWTKPSDYICSLNPGVATKIQAVYSREDKGILTVKFIIPDKYKQYLSWRIYKPSQNEEETVVDWNNEIDFKTTLAQGNYAIQINEYKIEIQNPFICYDFNTGELLNSEYVSIVGQNIEFQLEERKDLLFDFSNLDQGKQENFGYVKVNITPERIAELATWKLISKDRTSFPFKSEQIVKTPFGEYTVSPSKHIGWYVKENPTVSVKESNTITLVNLNYDINGNIRVKIEPDSAKDKGKWRIVGTETWYYDNEEITVQPGSYEIEFDQIDLHVKPENINISVSNNKVSVENVEYIPYGSLKVNITNNEFLTQYFDIPKWKPTNQERWNASESIIYIPPGDYTIEFNVVGNVFTHENIETSVSNTEENEITIEFKGVNLLGVPNKSNISFYSFNNYKQLEIFSDISKLKTVNQVIFDDGGKILAVLKNEEPFLEVCELTNFDLNYDVGIKPPNSGCRSGCFSSDSQYLVVSHNSFPYLTIYNLNDWSKLNLTSVPTNVCNVCCFDTNNTVLVVGYDQEPYLKFYNTSDWTDFTISEYPQSEVFSLKYKSDGTVLAVGCFNDIYLYNPVNSYSRIPFDNDEIVGTIFGVEFYNDFLIIITSLYFYIYHYSYVNDQYVKSTQISAPVTNLNSFIKLTKDNQYLIIGCADDPYVLIYKTSDWSRVEDFSSTNLDYCKKFDITKDLSDRDYVKIPQNIYPPDKYKGLREYEKLISSSFKFYSKTYGPEGCTHVKSQWRLLNNNKELLYDSGETDDLTEHLLPESYFDEPKEYYWQVRHKSDLIGWSFWSKPTKFRTIYSYIQQPVNQTPENNSIDISETPTFIASTFTVINSTDTHIKSEWKIFKKDLEIGEFVPLFTSGAVENLTEYTLPSGILKGKSELESPEYAWSVRYKGSLLGWSDWSEKTTFKTDEWYIEKPVNVSPLNEETNINEDNITFISSEFTCSGSIDSHTHTRYEIYNELDELVYSTGEISDTREEVQIEYQLPPEILSDGEKLYSWRVSYKGLNLGWSEWSDKTYFRTRILQQSNVIVNINPNYILPGRTELLRWRWRKSDSEIYSDYIQPGTTVEIKAPQEIIIEFEEYFGYQTPSSITVSLVPGRTYTYLGTYRLIKDGSLKCDLTPSLNTYWRIKSTNYWRPSGYTETNLAYSVYTIEFQDLTGYEKPSERVVTINSNSLVAISETYQKVETNYSIRINITSGGGQWYFTTNPNKKYNSGDVVPIPSNIEYGMIRFTDVPNYTKPSDLYFDIRDYSKRPDPYILNCLLYEVSYKVNGGFVKVNLNTNNGAWSIDDSNQWNTSGTTILVSPGSHKIKFKDIISYTKPDDILFNISTGQSLTFTGNYINELKQIVLIMPSVYALDLVQNPNVKYKMRYSKDGKTYNSWSNWINYFIGYDANGAATNNNVIKNPTPGFYEFEFSNVPGYTLSQTNYVVEYREDSVIVGVIVKYEKGTMIETTDNQIMLVINLLDSSGQQVSIDSTRLSDQKLFKDLIDNLEAKYAIIEDQKLAYDVAINKNHELWSPWYKVKDAYGFTRNSVTFPNLSSKPYYLLQFKPIPGYFNCTEYGLVTYVKFEGKPASKSFQQPQGTILEITYMYYGLLMNTKKICFEIRLNPSVQAQPLNSNFYVNIRVKNDATDPYGSPKPILIEKEVKYRYQDGKQIPYYGSDRYSIQEIFGTNLLGYITNDHVNIEIPGYKLEDINFTTPNLIQNVGFFQVAKASKLGTFDV